MTVCVFTRARASFETRHQTDHGVFYGIEAGEITVCDQIEEEAGIDL